MAYRNCLAAVVLGVLSVASAAPAFAGPEPPAGWTDGYVFANGIRIHYWRTGANTSKPPLVLAHGSSDDGLCWTNLAKEIQDGYDIIMFDARGHGLSIRRRPRMHRMCRSRILPASSKSSSSNGRY